MRVISANVNGIRAAQRRGGLEWMAQAQADVICLQEVRATAAQLSKALEGSALADFSLAHVESAAAGREGVAILTRHALTNQIDVIEGYGDAGRWVEADVVMDGVSVRIASVYVHTGEAETPKQDAKYTFLNAVEARMATIGASGQPAVVMGDFNIAHTQNDLKNWKGNKGKAGFLPEEQRYLGAFLESGWVDVVRHRHGDVPGPYSWWSWRGQAFDNDSGWRIDYQFATHDLAETVTHAFIGRADSYAERWSDHAAVVVDYDLAALARR